MFGISVVNCPTRQSLLLFMGLCIDCLPIPYPDNKAFQALCLCSCLCRCLCHCFVFVCVSSYNFSIAFIISFQNMYGYSGLYSLGAGIMIIFEMMTHIDTETHSPIPIIDSAHPVRWAEWKWSNNPTHPLHRKPSWKKTFFFLGGGVLYLINVLRLN